jgi:hypothetical protein
MTSRDDTDREAPPSAEYEETKRKDVEVLRELVAVLDADESEESIQKCVESHPELWRFVTANKPIVIPKMKLGERFVTDFMVFGSRHWCQSQTLAANFVELERAGARIFNRNGDPSATLTHAMRQVQDWKQWVSEHKQEVRDRLVEKTLMRSERSPFEGTLAGHPVFGFYDYYVIVIGRRHTMTIDERVRLQRMNEDTRGVKIVTYDMLIDCVSPEAPFAPWWASYATRTGEW